MNKQKFLMILFLHYLFTNCLDEPKINELDYSIPTTAELLYYFEQKGDFINSFQVPAVLNASQIFNNLENYNILDLRNQSKFSFGHINGAINITPDSLLFVVKTITNSSTNDIVLVSETGQLSAYYTSLLVLYGYSNVYSLNFGMAAWNNDFAHEWSIIYSNSENISAFNNEEYSKGPFHPLPILQLDDTPKTIEDISKMRITSVIMDQFLLNTLPMKNENNYLICYGNKYLYIAPKLDGPLPGYGHSPGTVHYYHEPFYELRSSSSLQTIPTNKEIIIYSYAGQLSAFIVAYLRVLGYNAKSLKYGASQFIYPRLLWSEFTTPFVFDSSKVMNYPYVIGQ